MVIVYTIYSQWSYAFLSVSLNVCKTQSLMQKLFQIIEWSLLYFKTSFSAVFVV